MNRRSLLTGMTLIGLAGEALNRAVANAQELPSESHLIDQFAATLSAHDIDAFAALFAETYINHQMSAAAPMPTGTTPKQASVGIFAARLKGLPDLQVTVETQIASNNMAAASFIYEGTHSGIFLGIPATGRRLRFTSCDIFRVANGKFVEHWGMGDLAGVMTQLRR